MHIDPTPRQVEVLQLVQSLTALKGYPPSLHELRDALRVSSANAVREHLRACERKGLLERDHGVARSLRLTAAGRRVCRG